MITRYYKAEPCTCDDVIDRTSTDSTIKAATLRVSPSLVNVFTYNLPDDMIPESLQSIYRDKAKRAYPGSGIIIQSNDAGDGTYFATILAPADLFKRTDALEPKQIKVDVRVYGGKSYKGEVLTCDFHYNVAAIKIQSDCPLKPATLRHLSDATPIDVDSNQHLQSYNERPFKRQHLQSFNSFDVQFGTKIMTAIRSFTGQCEIIISTGVLSKCDNHGCELPRQELFAINGSNLKCNGGGAVINCYGEVIGICFSDASFLPSNLVSRWWDHYESSRQIRRPYLGVEVANLLEACPIFLKQFVLKYPNISTGAVVTKVEENSPAHRCGIEPDDVIIKCVDDIRSKLEFLERVWDNTGQVVKLYVLKASGGIQPDLIMTIEETPRDKIYECKLPCFLWYKYDS